MKLTPCPDPIQFRSYANGAALQPGEFAWEIGVDPKTPLMADGWHVPTFIVFRCMGGKKRPCKIPVSLDGAAGTWRWNGDLQNPTLSPSIGCDQRCGWHGHIIGGDATRS